MKKILHLVTFVLISINIYSIESYIGLTPDSLINKIGSPNYIYSERGSRQEEDDIIFFYNNRFYAYFNQNRVWQIRADQNYIGEVLGIKMGNSLEDVKNILGQPAEELEESLLYKRPNKGYPIILRLYFSDSKLNDMYLYRGDY